MRSTFFGIETARRALWAHLRAIDVAAHNVANADTPGYSRQVARLRPTTPHSPSSPRAVVAGQVGTGVWVQSIDNLRVAFLDQQIGSVLGELDGWTERRKVYELLEVMLQEPSENGLQAALDRWFEALAILAANPESIEARTLVLERAQTIVSTMQSMDSQMEAIHKELTASLRHRVTELNDLARRVDALNRRIVAAEAGGSRANDLRDERAMLIEEISRLANVRVHETATGLVRISLGGVDLVGEGGARSVAVTVDNGTYSLTWVQPPVKVNIAGGGLHETLILLNNVIPGYRDDLLTFAQVLTYEVNEIHRQGYSLDGQHTGLAFFVDSNDNGLVPSEIRDWKVNPELIANPGLLAAAASPADQNEVVAPGDGSNAQKLVNLKYEVFDRNRPPFDNPNGPGHPFAETTLHGFYRAWVAAIGASSQEAQQMERNQQLLLSQLETHRQQVSGVSIDEELANILQYRQAYNAAARVLTVVDEMLSTLISGTGLVGR